MSKVLGPIHYWLYGKIEFLNGLVEKLSDLIIRKRYDDGILSEMEQKYGAPEKGSLENRIDLRDIHGWLQAEIAAAENRLAFLVTSMAAVHPECMSDIMNIAYEYGQSRKLSGGKSIEEVYKYLDDLLLNGMPCDRVNTLVSQSRSEIVWKQNVDIHAPYWEAVQGDVRYYYDIRERLAAGILKDSGFFYKQLKHQTFAVAMEVHVGRGEGGGTMRIIPDQQRSADHVPEDDQKMVCRFRQRL